jgi:pimeloyl-ACP methyl ester carboxylesterase
VLTIACSVLQSDYRSVLPKVQVPTLIIQARGHLPHITTPDEVLRPLEEFLGQ